MKDEKIKEIQQCGRNELVINSPTSISIGTICWFGLDTKLVGRIKTLLEENEKLKDNYERIYNENCILRENHNINDISLLDENEKLKSIIKEVRELADKYEMGKYDYNVPCFELKEILDKENK